MFPFLKLISVAASPLKHAAPTSNWTRALRDELLHHDHQVTRGYPKNISVCKRKSNLNCASSKSSVFWLVRKFP